MQQLLARYSTHQSQFALATVVIVWNCVEIIAWTGTQPNLVVCYVVTPIVMMRQYTRFQWWWWCHQSHTAEQCCVVRVGWRESIAAVMIDCELVTWKMKRAPVYNTAHTYTSAHKRAHPSIYTHTHARTHIYTHTPPPPPPIFCSKFVFASLLFALGHQIRSYSLIVLPLFYSACIHKTFSRKADNVIRWNAGYIRDLHDERCWMFVLVFSAA